MTTGSRGCSPPSAACCSAERSRWASNDSSSDRWRGPTGSVWLSRASDCSASSSPASCTHTAQARASSIRPYRGAAFTLARGRRLEDSGAIGVRADRPGSRPHRGPAQNRLRSRRPGCRSGSRRRQPRRRRPASGGAVHVGCRRAAGGCGGDPRRPRRRRLRAVVRHRDLPEGSHRRGHRWSIQHPGCGPRWARGRAPRSSRPRHLQ